MEQGHHTVLGHLPLSCHKREKYVPIIFLLLGVVVFMVMFTP